MILTQIHLNYKFKKNTLKNIYVLRLSDCLAKGVKILDGMKCSQFYYYYYYDITNGGIGKECLMYHSRLARLIAIKKGEQYAKTISWIRTRTSFLRTLKICWFVLESLGQEECHPTLRMFTRY